MEMWEVPLCLQWACDSVSVFSIASKGKASHQANYGEFSHMLMWIMIQIFKSRCIGHVSGLCLDLSPEQAGMQLE